MFCNTSSLSTFIYFDLASSDVSSHEKQPFWFSTLQLLLIYYHEIQTSLVLLYKELNDEHHDGKETSFSNNKTFVFNAYNHTHLDVLRVHNQAILCVCMCVCVHVCLCVEGEGRGEVVCGERELTHCIMYTHKHIHTYAHIICVQWN